MTNHLSQALNHWFENKDQTQWVLATIFKTEKSAYRKAGAMMLIDGHGTQYGLLSGGCLEADIKLNAKRVMQTSKCKIVSYDSMDEDDLAFQIGLGCGGVVHIILQPITAENDLGLPHLRNALNERKAGTYRQLISTDLPPRASFKLTESTDVNCDAHQSALIEDDTGLWLETSITPDPHLLIVGAGIDAVPVVDLAKQLGWKVSLVDPRPANARKEFFPRADHIQRSMGDDLSAYAIETRVDAVILMAHSVSLDAEGLKHLHNVPSLKYLALLGPLHRQKEVIDVAGLSTDACTIKIAGPAGLDIGGDLPESIALSILTECHCVLNKRNAQSLSNLL